LEARKYHSLYSSIEERFQTNNNTTRPYQTCFQKWDIHKTKNSFRFFPPYICLSSINHDSSNNSNFQQQQQQEETCIIDLEDVLSFVVVHKDDIVDDLGRVLCRRC
jgi:hypothetical protein